MAVCHVVTINQLPYEALPAPSRDVTVRETAEASSDIVLFPLPATSWIRRLVVLRRNPDLEAKGGVYPSVNDVDWTSQPYGPNGSEYQGTLRLPAVYDVKEGVMYGADGTEFVGTLEGGGGGGLAAGSLLIDPVTGRKYVYLVNPLIVGVG